MGMWAKNTQGLSWQRFTGSCIWIYSSTFAKSVCAALCMHKKGCHHCHAPLHWSDEETVMSNHIVVWAFWATEKCERDYVSCSPVALRLRKQCTTSLPCTGRVNNHARPRGCPRILDIGVLNYISYPRRQSHFIPWWNSGEESPLSCHRFRD